MQLKLMRHFGGAILIDDVASQALPAVRKRTLADLCREKFLTPSGILRRQLLVISFYDAASR
jgi:hypothetical protein